LIVYSSLINEIYQSIQCHAKTTEALLQGKSIAEEKTLLLTLKSLAAEIQPDMQHPLKASPKYRQDLACALFYRVCLD